MRFFNKLFFTFSVCSASRQLQQKQLQNSPAPNDGDGAIVNTQYKILKKQKSTAPNRTLP